MSELIDRQALLDAMKNRRWVTGRASDPVCLVEDAPTIDAVPVRHGEWISDRLVTTNGGTYGVRRCSRCEAYYQDIGYGWNYCPNCGARMDGGEHDLR